MRPSILAAGALRGLGAGLLAALVLMSAPPLAQAQSLGTVTIATHLDVDTLDPTQNINTHQRWVYRHIFDPLITLSADGKVMPAAAERWQQIDPLTWRFHLRKGVKFHNGEPLTAEAVKLTVELMQKTTSQARSYYSKFKEVKVIDDLTVDLITEKPFANTLILVADYLLPVPPKYFAEVGADGLARRPWPEATSPHQRARRRRSSNQSRRHPAASPSPGASCRSNSRCMTRAATPAKAPRRCNGWCRWTRCRW